jgi:hypothetical protein
LTTAIVGWPSRSAGSNVHASIAAASASPKSGLLALTISVFSVLPSGPTRTLTSAVPFVSEIVSSYGCTTKTVTFGLGRTSTSKNSGTLPFRFFSMTKASSVLTLLILKLIGSCMRVETGLPPCVPGANFHCSNAAIAGASNAGCVDVRTSGFRTFPFSSTMNLIMTFPAFPDFDSAAG